MTRFPWLHRSYRLSLQVLLILTLMLGWAIPVRAEVKSGVKYSQQYTPPPSYSGSILIGQDFSGQSLRVAEFAKADVIRTNFSDANLKGAIFSAATMTDTNFQGADLSQAMLDQTRLRRVDFRDAILEDALLFYTSFEGVKITGADFTNALLDGAQVRELCEIADGVNSKTGVATRDSLGCSENISR
jgi:uncharacterized protein YjbI with pentapeptide repeats